MNQKEEQYERDRLKIIFDYSPVAILEEDFSVLAKLRDRLESENIHDYKNYLLENFAVVEEMFKGIEILDVNKSALNLYESENKEDLKKLIKGSFRAGMVPLLVNQFSSLMKGSSNFEAGFTTETSENIFHDVTIKISVPQGYRDSLERVIVIVQDVTAQKEFERHLKVLARTDGLTRLWNHNAIVKRLEEESNRAQRYGSCLSCLMVDVDCFKEINDKHGHQNGDAVINYVAQQIKSHVRAVDIVGRFGGDEFLVILPETPVNGAKVAANRILNIFSKDVEINADFILPVTLSIGICGFFSGEHMTAKNMLSGADQAMYKVKEKGKNNVEISDEGKGE